VTGTIRAETFEQSIGVNVHVEYTDGTYANAKNVVADLAYLGIDHVRDASLNPANQGQSDYGVLAAAGIKFDMIMMGTNIGSSLSLLNAFETKYPGSISAIEGPNEINNQPISYNGLTGNAAGVAYQDALYSAVEADSTLNDLPVYSLTGNTSAGEATDVNVHAYPVSGNQPYSALSSGLSATPGLSTAAGAVLTEAGYYTLTDGVGWGGVDEHTQATLTLNLLMDATKLGYSQIYLYQLMDAYADPSGTNVDAAFGMFDLSNDPKPVAVAIHNLMDILDDTGSTATSFTTGTLNYSISGLPTTGSSLLMEKSNGAYDIVVWNEPHVWNSTTETEVAVAPTTVTVNLGGTFASVAVYDPLSGTTSIETAANASSIQVSLTDHPLIIEVSGSETAGGAPVAISSSASTTAAASTSSGTIVGAHKTLSVTSGLIMGGAVTSGGAETVSATGRLSGTVVSSGGLLNVSSGGSASGISVLKGGIVELYAGGGVSGAVLTGGGGEGVQGGGVDTGATLSGGGYINLHSGGTANATKILNGGIETALSGGLISGAIVSSGGLLNVSSGGVAKAPSVLAGGIVEVYAGAAISGSVLAGGGEGVQGGGADTGATLSSGGYLNLHSGGTANATTVLNGGVETVLSNGLAAAAVVSSGGLLNVSSGGVARNMSVLIGGGATIYAHGTATSSFLLGGHEGVQSGGGDTSATVSSGGSLTVYNGGAASVTDVLNGGTETVLSGGVLSGATVVSGGALVISSGATLKSTLVLSGGTATVLGAVASGVSVNFATSGGELVLDDAPAFSGTIAGMHDASEHVDLGGFAYSSTEKVSWTEAGNKTSGVLSITDGAKTAKLSLVGSYVTSNFVLSSDGAGGTLVVDPPVPVAAANSNANLASFVQAMASFAADAQTANAASRFTPATNLFNEAILTAGATSSAAHR